MDKKDWIKLDDEVMKTASDSMTVASQLDYLSKWNKSALARARMQRKKGHVLTLSKDDTLIICLISIHENQKKLQDSVNDLIQRVKNLEPSPEPTGEDE